MLVPNEMLSFVVQCYLCVLAFRLVSYSWPPGERFIGHWARVLYPFPHFPHIPISHFPFPNFPISRSARNISGLRLNATQPPNKTTTQNEGQRMLHTNCCNTFISLPLSHSPSPTIARFPPFLVIQPPPLSIFGQKSVYCFFCLWPISSCFSFYFAIFRFCFVLLFIVSPSVPHYFCISIAVQRQVIYH